MIRDPFKLRHHRAQRYRARWRTKLERSFHGAREGKRIRDGAVPGHARGNARRFGDRLAAQQLLDALVRVTEALFETDNRLPARGEPEMTGLDDAGMHRTDWESDADWGLRSEKPVGRTMPRRGPSDSASGRCTGQRPWSSHGRGSGKPTNSIPNSRWPPAPGARQVGGTGPSEGTFRRDFKDAPRRVAGTSISPWTSRDVDIAPQSEEVSPAVGDHVRQFTPDPASRSRAARVGAVDTCASGMMSSSAASPTRADWRRGGTRRRSGGQVDARGQRPVPDERHRA